MDIVNIKSQIKSLFKKGAFHLFIGNFLIKFIGIFGSIFIVRLLTKEEYGVLGYVENLYSYGYIFVGLGLSMALLRYGIVLEDEASKIGTYKFIYKTQTLINIFIILIISLMAVVYPHPSQYSGVQILLIALSIGLPFQDLTSASLVIERTKMENKQYMYFSIMAAGISVVFRIIGSWMHGVEGTVLFKVAAEILTCFVICSYCYRRYIKGRQSKVITKALKKEIMLYSVNNMLANGIWILFMITEVYLIGRILNDPDALADYKVACVVPSNMAIITSSIAVFICPYFVKNENNLKWVKRNYFRVMKVSIVLMGALALFLFIFSPQIIWVLYGEKYLNVVTLMRILIIAYFINSSIKSLQISLLAAMGYSKVNLITSIIGFLIQVISISLILPIYGVIGVAVNNIMVYSLMALIITIVFFKKYHFLSNGKENG